MSVVGQHQRTLRIDIAPRAIVLIVATGAALWLLRELWTVALIVVMALVLAGTFNPLVEWMERRGLSQALALIVLFVLLVLAGAAFLFFTVPPLTDQLAQLARDAPALQARLVATLARFTLTVPLAHLVQGVAAPERFASLEQQLLAHVADLARGLGYAATTVVLAFYLLADGKRTQGVLYAFVPRDYHLRLARIIHNMETIVGGYVRGQLVTSAAIGVFTCALLAVVGVPNAVAIALFAALVDVIPFVGGLLVVVPAVLVALGVGVTHALTVLVALIVYLEFENRILVPRVYGNALRLSPTAVLLALLTGGALMGTLGALIALPIAAGLIMILEEMRVELPGDDSGDRGAGARHEKAEAMYDQMSAGTTPPEAGAIARHIAAGARDAEAAESSPD